MSYVVKYTVPKYCPICGNANTNYSYVSDIFGRPVGPVINGMVRILCYRCLNASDIKVE